MSAEALPALEWWDLSRPEIPPRSRLYHLKPMGVGTPYVESLTGYLARLGEAHRVGVRRLLVVEILPLLCRSHLLGMENHGLSAFWQKETRAINGTRTLAKDLVRALEGLTLRGDLRFLTLLPWAEVLPPRDLIRPYHAWCPACYQEWRQAAEVVYEPLLWSLSVVTFCPRHHRRLQSACPYPDCRRRLPALAQRSRPGYCPWCERWLGEEREPAGDAELREEELRWQSWVTSSVGELLAATPALSAPLSRDAVTRAINRHITQVTGGNVTALAERLGLEMITLSAWKRGRSIPCLGLLLRVCYRLGTKPLAFLLDDATTTTVAEGNQIVPPKLPRPSRTNRQPFDAAKMQRALEAVMASGESPPPSMREVSRRLGTHHSFLIQKLPELCRAISARYLAHHREQGAQKRQRLCAEIRQAVHEVHRWGLYPSASRIAPLLSQPGFIQDHVARVTWQEALNELGWRAGSRQAHNPPPAGLQPPPM
jgi:transcriptional regulator with XRE-family HTH domain